MTRPTVIGPATNPIHHSDMKNQAEEALSHTVSPVKICGVYAFKHVPSGMLYIGSSVDCMSRKRRHKSRGHHFYRCATKLGWENFTFTILEECSLRTLRERELHWIHREGSLHPKGFNVHKDPTKPWGCVYTKEMRESRSLQSKAIFAANPNLAAEMSKRTKERMSTPEAKQAFTERMRIFHEGRCRQLLRIRTRKIVGDSIDQLTKDGIFIARHKSATAAALVVNREHSAISRAVIIGCVTGGYRWMRTGESSPVQLPFKFQIDQFTRDGAFIARHDSAAKASAATGCNRSSISRAVNLGCISGGYRWKKAS